MIRDDPNSPAQQLAQLREENERLRVSLQQSTVQLAESSSKVELLRAERTELISELKQKDHEIDSLQHRLQMLLRRYFGR